MKTDNNTLTEGTSQTTLFKNKEIRRVFHDNEWFFSVADIVKALTETKDVKQYIKSIRQRDTSLNSNWGVICTPVEMKAKDGKRRKITCAKVEGIFRIIQAIPSSKAEPFKRWFAKVAYERIQEFHNPEIAIKRAILTYQTQGYDNDWIEARIRTIVTRKELTDDWQNRGVKNKEYGILTNVIQTETFGLGVKEHKTIKSLKPSHNLRDHMTDIELILTMLGERSTVKIARKTDAQGFLENQKASKAGGKIAGTARKNLEEELGESMVSEENYLTERQKKRLPSKAQAILPKLK